VGRAMGNAGTLVSYNLRDGRVWDKHDPVIFNHEGGGMRKRRNYLIIFMLLLITSGFVFMDGSLSKSVRTINLEKLPLTIGGWQGKSYPVQERILQILETEYILDRDYVNGDGRHIFLSIVYYPDNKIGFHNPESCNIGAGSKIIQKDVLSIRNQKPNMQGDGFKANRLILQRTAGDKVILYFYVSGNYITHDYLKFRFHMMKQQMGFQRPSGAQIQIHGTIAPDLKTTVSVMEDFIRNLAPLLPDYLS
jgi:EpsI family protein